MVEAAGGGGVVELASEKNINSLNTKNIKSAVQEDHKLKSENRKLKESKEEPGENE